MDPRNTPSHQPFARPLSQSGVRDARHAPIPPPPYTLQAPLRTSQPTLNHDPFLPRRNEQEDSHQEPYKSLGQASFNLGNYAAGLQREASKVGLENRDRVQENGTSWMLGDGRIDRYRSQSGDGKQLPICFIQLPYTALLSLHMQGCINLHPLGSPERFPMRYIFIACTRFGGNRSHLKT